MGIRAGRASEGIAISLSADVRSEAMRVWPWVGGMSALLRDDTTAVSLLLNSHREEARLVSMQREARRTRLRIKPGLTLTSAFRLEEHEKDVSVAYAV